ncbi:MAG: SUMF1/EgtB/PvdO family nonheme iron enzyme [Anaerolineae bacterium]|nr:SUMF1/EgtB/PvdO family nonheme iron enzyme [Anaerolineae bacterium]
MPLTREQFNQIVELLIPHVNASEDDRRALIQRAFFGEPVVEQLTYSGQAVTFAMNCVLHLRKYNTETSVIQLLKTLRDYYVGPDVQAQINVLLAEIDGKPATPTSGATETTVRAGTPVLDAPLFISYSRRDFAFVNRLRGDLKARGIPYWIDQEGLSPGTPNWERAIRAAIHDSSAVLWIVSPAAYESEYVSSELAVAEMYKRKIYPVWVDGDNWIACVPLGKHNIQNVDMRESRYPAGLEQLLAALGKTDSEYIVPPEETPEAPTSPRNPYKGLMAFTEDDVQDFFGRGTLVASLVKRLQDQLAEGKARFLAVLGPSGAGKSSVVMAGLLPALNNKNAIPGSAGWRYLPTITPGVHPMEKLAGALATLTSSADPTAVLTKLYTLGIEYLNIIFDMLPAGRVVLYIDQFEELFTLAKDDGERQQFISLLSGAATEPNGKLIVVLSMRADFLDYPLNYPQLGSLFNAYNELVQPMSIPELRNAIQKPAQQSGLTFDDGLVADIVFALRGQDKALAGALPLLQFTLERLYEERDGTYLTRSAYERMGGVSGAIGTHSEAVYQGLPEAAQDTLGQVFLPLVNIDEETGEPTRRRAPLADVIADPNARTLVDAFVDNGLLQRGRDSERRYLEVTHEALLRSWDTLVKWIAEVRGDLHTLRELRKAAALWEANDRSRDFLWLGDRGQDAQAMIARLNPDLNETERAFARPEAEHLLDEITEIDTLHPRRSEISTRLHQLKYTLPGAGLREDRLPDMVWLLVEGSGRKHKFEFGEFEVKPFFIAQHLTTYVQFQAFLDHPDGFENSEWWRNMPEKNQKQRVSDPRQPYTNYPRDSVSWYQAVAFTRWLDAQYRETDLMEQFLAELPISLRDKGLGDEGQWQIRLPTEWEWQWAAQNGAEARQYPWVGGEWDGRRCNTSEVGLSRTTAVGMYPHGAAECGALDVAGNLFEWCANNHDKPEIIDAANASSKVLRGGSFYHAQNVAAAPARHSYYPFSEYDSYGFRLVLGAPMRL